MNNRDEKNEIYVGSKKRGVEAYVRSKFALFMLAVMAVAYAVSTFSPGRSVNLNDVEPISGQIEPQTGN